MTPPEALDEATKLTVYVGRLERVGRAPAHVAICELLHRRGLSGASVLLGVDGGRRGRRSRARFFGRNADVPLMAIAVGATCLRGIWGFHGDHAPHGDKLFQIRCHVPVCTVVIDTPERIGRSFAIVDEPTATQGLVTSEMVPAAAAISATKTLGGLRLANHDF